MREVADINFLGIEETEDYNELINNVLEKCFEEENLSESKLYISIILTNPDEIQKINKEYRKVDKATDVLSFPIYERDEIPKLNREIEEPIGDVIISLEKVEEQAKEYGHSFERELSYMLVHGFYHLMGYDHIEESDKQEMRKKEEKILTDLNITRDNA